MKYTFRYTYSEYKDFPEATQISKTRAELLHFWTFVLFSCYLVSAGLIFAADNLVDRFIGIFLLIFSICFSVYLFKYYDIVTEKKIRKAIEQQIQIERDATVGKYKCLSIKILNASFTGTCMMCNNPRAPLTLCKIKKDIGTRELHICEHCIRKFKGLE